MICSCKSLVHAVLAGSTLGLGVMAFGGTGWTGPCMLLCVKLIITHAIPFCLLSEVTPFRYWSKYQGGFYVHYLLRRNLCQQGGFCSYGASQVA